MTDSKWRVTYTYLSIPPPAHPKQPGTRCLSCSKTPTYHPTSPLSTLAQNTSTHPLQTLFPSLTPFFSTTSHHTSSTSSTFSILAPPVHHPSSPFVVHQSSEQSCQTAVFPNSSPSSGKLFHQHSASQSFQTLSRQLINSLPSVVPISCPNSRLTFSPSHILHRPLPRPTTLHPFNLERSLMCLLLRL